MNPVSQNLSSTFGQNPSLSNLGNTKISQASYLFQAKKSMEISLYTSEGDKVTLSTASDFSASYATYNESGEIGGRSVQIAAEGYSFSQSYTASLTIEGDLSAAEREDIGKALHQIEKMTHHFLRGEAGKEEHEGDRIAHIMDLKSISGFEASMQIERTYTALEAYGQTTIQALEAPREEPLAEISAPPIETPPEIAVTEASQQAPLSPPVQNTEPLATEAEASANHPETGDGGEKVKGLAKKIGQVVDDSNLDRHKMTKHLSKFFDHLFKNLGQREKMASPSLRLAKQLQAALLDQLSAPSSHSRHENTRS